MISTQQPTNAEDEKLFEAAVQVNPQENGQTSEKTTAPANSVSAESSVPVIETPAEVSAATQTTLESQTEAQEPESVQPTDPVVPTSEETLVETQAASETTPEQEPTPQESIQPVAAQTNSAIAEGGRASNDPRLNPKPLADIAIETKKVEIPASQALDTSTPATIEHKPRAITRPANDPRARTAQSSESQTQAETTEESSPHVS